MGNCVAVQVSGGLATIRLDRPPMNAISVQMQAEVRQAAATISATPAIRAAVVYGGERTFAAGADVKEMADKECPAMVPVSRAMHASFTAIATIPKPVVAAVTGYALGGGCELTICCDLRIASEKARFGQPEITVGVIPGAGGTQRLARLIGMTRAKELIYTGDMIDAATALSYGLVNKVVPVEDLMTEARALAEKLLSRSSVALYYAKKTMNSGFGMSLTSALDSDENFFARCFATEDQKEGMQAFLEKRKPIFKNK